MEREFEFRGQKLKCIKTGDDWCIVDNEGRKSKATKKKYGKMNHLIHILKIFSGSKVAFAKINKFIREYGKMESGYDTMVADVLNEMGLMKRAYVSKISEIELDEIDLTLCLYHNVYTHKKEARVGKGENKPQQEVEELGFKSDDVVELELFKLKSYYDKGYLSKDVYDEKCSELVLI
jgi:hypothetical protein